MDKATLVAISDSLKGRRILGVQDSGPYDKNSVLLLEGGMQVELYESWQDCCAGASGEWAILDAENLMAGITDVQFEDITEPDDTSDPYYEPNPREATLTILHNQNPIVKGNLYADSGNGGYYFSVLSLKIRFPDSSEYDTEVLSS